MNLKYDKRRLIIKGKEGKDYQYFSRIMLLVLSSVDLYYFGLLILTTRSRIPISRAGLGDNIEIGK